MTLIYSDRRKFLRQSAGALAALGTTVCWTRVAKAACAPTGNHLVWHHHNGGPDYLNWLSPIDSSVVSTMQQIRPTLFNMNTLLPTDGHWGLNPGLSGIKTLYDNNMAAMVVGVGHPVMSQSHDIGRDSYLTGSDPMNMSSEGLIVRTSRYNNFSSLKCGAGLTGNDTSVDSAHELVFDGPLDTYGASGRANSPGVTSLASYAVSLGDLGTRTGDHLKASWDSVAKDSTSVIGAKVNLPPATGPGAYPNTTTGQILGRIRALILTFPGYSTFSYFTTGGNDTHGNELNANAQIHKEISDAYVAFHMDSALQGKGVTAFTTGDFSRTIRENNNGGTDHGGSTTCFITGEGVNKGVYGENWTQNQLLSGSNALPMKFDQRAVYMELCQKRLGLNTNWESIFPGFSFPGNIGFVS